MALDRSPFRVWFWSSTMTRVFYYVAFLWDNYLHIKDCFAYNIEFPMSGFSFWMIVYCCFPSSSVTSAMKDLLSQYSSIILKTFFSLDLENLVYGTCSVIFSFKWELGISLLILWLLHGINLLLDAFQETTMIVLCCFHGIDFHPGDLLGCFPLVYPLC